jgi:hypothetical protein
MNKGEIMRKLIISDAPQGSPEWQQARVGIVSASNFADLQAKGEGKSRRAYLLRIVGERLSGVPYAGYKNGHMDRGNEHEPLSCLSYECATGNMVQKVGFIRFSDAMIGCSPDGLVDDDGGIEMKNVIPSVQVETWERGEYPPSHKAQIQGNLWITGRRYWDFVSHSEDIKDEKLRTYIFRVERDEAYIKNIETEVERFLAEVNVTIADLKRRVA